jgi:hypothetical protein
MSYGDKASALKKDTRTEAELLASTVKSLAEADDTTDRVLTTLHGQTEQLHRIKADADAIHHNLDQSEWLLRSLKPWGWVRNIFRKDPVSSAPSASASSAPAALASDGKDSKVDSKAPAQPAPPAPAPGGYPEGSRGAARLLADDAARRAARNSTAAAAAQSQQQQRPDLRDPNEKAYEQIDNMLEGLLVKSQQINRTLGHHNELLPEIADSVDRDQARITKQKAEIKKRIGWPRQFLRTCAVFCVVRHLQSATFCRAQLRFSKFMFLFSSKSYGNIFQQFIRETFPLKLTRVSLRDPRCLCKGQAPANPLGASLPAADREV